MPNLDGGVGLPFPALDFAMLAFLRMVSSSRRLIRVLADFGMGRGPRRPRFGSSTGSTRAFRTGRSEKRGGIAGINAPNISFMAEGATSSTLPGAILPN